MQDSREKIIKIMALTENMIMTKMSFTMEIYWYLVVTLLKKKRRCVFTLRLIVKAVESGIQMHLSVQLSEQNMSSGISVVYFTNISTGLKMETERDVFHILR